MAENENKKIVAASDELKESVDKLTEAVWTNLKQQHAIETEPYEKYCHHVHLNLIKDVGDFQKRCYEGYLALLHHIDSPE